MDISEPNRNFNFSNLSLNNPQVIQGGASYFSKITLTNTSNKDKSLYVQLPKCKTKQGIVTTKKEKYCDFLFQKNEQKNEQKNVQKNENTETDELFDWIDHLEKKCQELIDSKKTLWFHNDITLEDIENMMIPVCRLYKSGKNILIRSSIDIIKKTGKEKCLAYDERENLISLDDIKETQDVIPLLLIEGITFSTKSFEISVKVIQLMVCEEEDVCEEDKKCLIKASNNVEKDWSKKTVSEESSIPVNSTLQQSISSPLLTVKKNAQESKEVKEGIQESTDIQESEGKVGIQESEGKVGIQESEGKVGIQESTDIQESINPVFKLSDNVSKKESDKINNVGEMEEVQFDFNNIKESINIKSSNEIYKNLIEKTNELKKKYIDALLTAKKFKKKYKLKEDIIVSTGLSDLEYV